MDFPYTAIFLVLLIVYMVYSQWVRLDSRYPIGGALVLLVAAAIADAFGAVQGANSLAIFAFFLLSAGVILLLIDYLRGHQPATPFDQARSAVTQTPRPEPSEEIEPATNHPLHRLEEQSIPQVETTRRQHDRHENARGPQAHQR